MQNLNIKQLIEQNDSKRGRIFDLSIQALIVVSLISFSIETLPDLSKNTVSILNTIELITVMIFTVEYLLRIIVADRKLGFILSFYGMVDLLAILPFYISTDIDLRSIRAWGVFIILPQIK